MKVDNWQNLLIEYIASAANGTFAYGQQDCALFAAGAVDIQLGTQYVRDWVGKYKSWPEGLRKLRKLGHDDHLALFGKHLTEVLPPFAQVGDIAAMGDAMGIVQGAGIYVLQDPKGIGLAPLTSATRVFRVE